MLSDAATARTLPPASTREIARSRKSIDKGFAIHAGLRPSIDVKSNSRLIGKSPILPIPSRSRNTSTGACPPELLPMCIPSGGIEQQVAAAARRRDNPLARQASN